MVAVLSVPSSPPDTALLVVVGGPQYRVGSHRQFVRLANYAAGAGFAALRFDTRGMGDSEGRQRTFEEIEADIAAAIDALVRTLPSVRRICIWGLCGGASAALLYCRSRRDSRVAGLALVNPWVRSEITHARTRVKHYYLQRVFQAEFWKKLVRGRVASGAIMELIQAMRVAAASGLAAHSRVPAVKATLEQRMLDGLASFTGEVLLVLSGNDYTAKEFLETVALDSRWQAQFGRNKLHRLDLDSADHTFSQFDHQKAVERSTVEWLCRSRAG